MVEGTESYWHSVRSRYFSTISLNMLSERVGEVGESRNRALELPVNTW
jgi:hypothetical protein